MLRCDVNCFFSRPCLLSGSCENARNWIFLVGLKNPGGGRGNGNWVRVGDLREDGDGHVRRSRARGPSGRRCAFV
jgi:hypothetical protein